MIIKPSAKKDISNIAFGGENTVLTYKLNNFDKKNMKKKQIIDSLKEREIELMKGQLVKEKDRYIYIENEKDRLMGEVNKKKVSLFDVVNVGLVLMIVYILFLVSKNLYTRIKILDQYPVESFTNE